MEDFSKILEDFLQNNEEIELKVSYPIPECESVKYVSDKTTGMEIVPIEAQVSFQQF